MPSPKSDVNSSDRDRPDTVAEESELPEGSADSETATGRLRSVTLTLAERYAASRRPGRRPSPVKILRERASLLRDAYERFRQQSEEAPVIPTAAEWLLDNYYLVRQALRQIAEDLPDSYYQELPKLDGTPLEDYPRVYALMRQAIKDQDALVDVAYVIRFVRAYQEAARGAEGDTTTDLQEGLTMGELWAIPTMLRIALLELLIDTVADVAELPASDKAKRDGGSRYPHRVDLASDLATDTVVAHCVRSLRIIANNDWSEFFEQVSQVDAVLRRDPAGFYGRMTFKSRDRYRKVVETLALHSEWSEVGVAREAVVSAEAATTADRDAAQGELGDAGVERRSHVGFYLLGQGRAQLESALAYRPTFGERLRRWSLDHATVVYLSSIVLITLLVVVGLIAYGAAAGGSVGSLLLIACLALIPGSIVGVNAVNAAVTRLLAPSRLPKLDFSEGIPDYARAVVVVPAMLTTPGEVDYLIERLERHYLSNAPILPSRNLRFALLTDFADAPQEQMPEDAALLARAKAGIEALNRRYRRSLPGATTTESSGDAFSPEDDAATASQKREEDYHPFYLLHRRRQWNDKEGTWMGWERKRGKLEEFNRLLLGAGDTSYTTQVGDIPALVGTRYVITLDSDTVLAQDSTYRLIATLAHPLNRAEFDEETGRVVAGYTVLQPRTEVKPSSANATRLTRIFAGDAGLDLYTLAVSDVYQDLFDEGIFVGKGIYDVAAFHRSLKGRVPENALLSHDLFEGVHGRAGLVTDIILYEDYPEEYLTYMHRQHRWWRGDWQLLPWLFPRVPSGPEETSTTRENTLSVLDRWKIFDNLRRSLRSPALLLFLLAGWLVFPGSPWWWTLAGLLISAMPLVTGFVTALSRFRITDSAPIVQTLARAVLAPMRVQMLRWLTSLTFLPYEAAVALHAMGVTLIRLFVTHRHLLQWITAAHTLRTLGDRQRATTAWRRMLIAPIVALSSGIAVLVVDAGALPAAAALLLLWLISPQIGAYVGTSIEREAPSLTSDERNILRRLARRTWLYFERFVGPEDHWLPPDHFQEDPRGLVAHRTSPTNIGLLLLSTLSAHDLGYVGPLTLLVRLRSTLDSMARLERHRGHFLNWYATHDLSTLDPRYVSTVDSGNLAASLVVLKEGLRRLPEQRLPRWQRWEGLRDALGVLEEVLSSAVDDGAKEALTGTEGLVETVGALEDHLGDIRRQVRSVRATPKRLPTLLDTLSSEGLIELHRLITSLLEVGAEVLEVETLRGLRLWSERVHYHLRNMRDELDVLLPWLLPLAAAPAALTDAAADSDLGRAWQSVQDALPAAPQLGELPDICQAGREAIEETLALLIELADDNDIKDARAWCEMLIEELEQSRQRSQSLLIGIRGVADQAERMVNDMDFGFLFDRNREVFYLGYRVDTEQLDTNHYDLLASEARTASLIAIAKGEVPQSHWLHLSRPIAEMAGMRALLSWNGSMFEYLMPDLFSRSYDGTLLAQTNRAVVARQIAYGRENGVPWGVSESGYYRFDGMMNYQYQGFGVPGTGRKRGLGDDLVIAPYASLLATKIAPQAVLENLDALRELGMMGQYGFYESVDYTGARLPLGRDHAIIKSYMVHHQGMILLALTNVLRDNAHPRRFHADRRIQTVELLLQERIPVAAPVEAVSEEAVAGERESAETVTMAPWEPSTDTPLPQVHYLSNGEYSVLITAGGGGYSRWRDVALTRWRADTTRDNWGTWVYVQDLDSDQLWSLTDQPVAAAGTATRASFYPHQVQFMRRVDSMVLQMDVAVAPDDPVEIRRVVLINHSDQPRHLRLVSYGEVVLAPQATDRRHAAFNKMFIESEYLADVASADRSTSDGEGVSGDGERVSASLRDGAVGEEASRTPVLLFKRRQRSSEEPARYMGHALLIGELGAGSSAQSVTYETDRARFIGRGRSSRSPQALDLADPEQVGATDGAMATAPGDRTRTTLDPIMALGEVLTVAPHTTVTVVYLTVASEDDTDAAARDAVLSLLKRYRSQARVEQALEAARSQSETELRNLQLDSDAVARIQLLLSALLYPYPAMRAEPEALAANQLGQSSLWPHAISGDYPILLVRLKQQEDLPLVREVLLAHTYWRHRNLKIDVVLFNEKDVGYEQELNQQLRQVLHRTGSDAYVNSRGGIFLINAGRLDQASRTLLLTAARVVFSAEAGAFEDQLRALREPRTWLPALISSRSGIAGGETEPSELVAAVERPDDLRFDNGYGGFSQDGHSYVIYLSRGAAQGGSPSQDQSMLDGIPGMTPAPWINVVANEDFGFLVTESGSGYTWAANSGENRLTPWPNDPLTPEPGEVLYLRDEETAEVWTPTPQPAGPPRPYLVRHEPGRTTFTHHSHGLLQRLELFVSPDAPVKVVRLALENASDRPRRLTATYYAAWVLGVDRDSMQQYVVPEYDDQTGALLARNTYNAEFGERVAFLASDRQPHGVTTDRTEFLGSGGDLRRPAALNRVGLSGNISPGGDPCGAYQVHLDLEVGAGTQVIFLLGQGADRDEALALVKRFQDTAEVSQASERVDAFWRHVLDTITVRTPDPSMNVVLPWLLYQALSCRIWGRSALYQSSGAYGFRDQLQDVMSLLHARPDLARAHILRAAAHQFEEGDVLHWWHPPSGRGVRTRISDDLLWLPYVTAEYVSATGDAAILEERVPFRQGEPLGGGEEERYAHYGLTESTATLYEHCLRALEKGTTSGRHGLPLMGAGDWNDGMNRVGIEGRGESIWLGWFLHATMTRFAALAESRDDEAQVQSLRSQAETLRRSLIAEAWDGEWYRRAYYDDGTPLGSSRNKECRIDSLAQSWSVISGAGGGERAATAMGSVEEKLVRDEDGLLLLFTPPFDKTPRDPGYIKGYPPGIRENGGQYTHAAIWAVWALAEMGRGDRAAQLFHMLNPVNHSRSREAADTYQVEPYVVAADIYSVPPYVGHGGWTWYTGSSGWLYRLGIEAILGLHREGDALRVDPVIPEAWERFDFTYRFGDSVYRVVVENPNGVCRGVVAATLDDEPLSDNVIPLTDDGEEHDARIVMGK